MMGLVKWYPHDGIIGVIRRDTRELALSSLCEDIAKANIRKLEREPLSEPRHADAVILDFQPPELWENKFLLFKSPSLYFVGQIKQTEKKYVLYNTTYNIITHDVPYKNISCYLYFLLAYSFSVHSLFYFSTEACTLLSI